MVRHGLRLTALTLGMVGLLGCGQTGEESYGCKPTSFTAMDLSETTPLGFSAADALPTVEGSTSWTLSYANGDPDTDLTIDVAHNAGDIEFITYEWDGGDGNMEVAMGDCYDLLRIPVDATFATTDGALSETRAHFVDARAVDRAMYWEDWQSDEIGGTLDIGAFTEEDWDSTWASVRMDYNASTIAGELTGMGELAQGNGPDGTVVAGLFDIAAWGATMPPPFE